MTLLSALSATTARGQQLQIVRAYWRLAQAVAEYHFCWDHAKTLDRIKMAGRADASLRLAESTAAAQLREAELNATRKQFELSELLRSPPGSPLPLPSDRPLVVPYRTSYKELFASRTPPEPARLAEKILPIQRQAIDDRAAAVQAAEDAFVAVTDDLQTGRSSTAAVASCSRELLRQQRAFAEAVGSYNRNIADYALMVVASGTSAQDLVNILIGPPQSTGTSAPSGAAPPSGTAPPTGTSPPSGMAPPSNNGRAVRTTSGEEPIETTPARRWPRSTTRRLRSAPGRTSVRRAD